MKCLAPRGNEYIEQIAGRELHSSVFGDSKAAPRASQGSSGKVEILHATSRQDQTQSPATPKACSSMSALAAARTSETASPSGRERTHEADGLPPQVDLFYYELRLYSEENGVHFKIEHQIGGRTLTLWELFAAISKQEVPFTLPEDVDWFQVAKDLSYDPDQEKEIPAELRRCFEDNMLNFCDNMESLDEEKQAANEAAQVLGPPLEQKPRQDVEDWLFLSPSTQAAGRKRSLEFDLSSSGRGFKRRRVLGRDAEIPATPDVNIRSMGYSQSCQDSPSFPRITPTMEEAGGAAESRQGSSQPDADEVDDQAALTVEHAGSGRQASPRAGSVVQQSQGDEVTPSQQLRSEAFDASPIPLRLTHGRRDAKPAPAKEASHSQSNGNSVASTTASQANTKASRRTLPASFGLSGNRAPARPRDEFTGPLSQAPSWSPAGSRVRPRERPKSDGERVAEWVEYYESLGYSNDIVVDALKRTTMRPGGLAALVMQSLKDGQGVPANHECVWTDRDDQGLRMMGRVDADGQSAKHEELGKAKREAKRLTRKHGAEEIQLRKRFLEAQRAGE